jgi:hypothetical protein
VQIENLSTADVTDFTDVLIYPRPPRDPWFIQLFFEERSGTAAI